MDPATTRAVAKATEEAAKTAGKALEIAHDTGGYLSRVVGDLPANTVGLLGADWLRERRVRNLDGLRRRTTEILRERDVKSPIELSPNQATELLTAAQDESRKELADLWARLLANAMDPNMNNVRHSFIAMIKEMDPLDAVVLRFLSERNLREVHFGRLPMQKDFDAASKALSNAVGREVAFHEAPSDAYHVGIGDMARVMGRSSDEIEVSLRHLQALSFFDVLPEPAFSTWRVNAINRLFMEACYPNVTR